jgi:hypothetical protein
LEKDLIENPHQIAVISSDLRDRAEGATQEEKKQTRREIE